MPPGRLSSAAILVLFLPLPLYSAAYGVGDDAAVAGDPPAIANLFDLGVDEHLGAEAFQRPPGLRSSSTRRVENTADIAMLHHADPCLLGALAAGRSGIVGGPLAEPLGLRQDGVNARVPSWNDQRAPRLVFAPAADRSVRAVAGVSGAAVAAGRGSPAHSAGE